MTEHPLTAPAARSAIEAAVSGHLGRGWHVDHTTDLAERASHPAMILRGDGLAVFAKLMSGPGARTQVSAELADLNLIGTLAGVAVPRMVGLGSVDLGSVDLPDGSSVLLFEALDERAPDERTQADWESIGRTLARIHSVHGDRFGLDHNGFFGPLTQDNSPTLGGTWGDFYRERRLLPTLATAVAAGSLDPDIAIRVERLADRLAAFAGPEPRPSLLHGDAQHHNFVSTPAGAVVIDPSPYFGHPELDLALLGYFTPVPNATFAAYAEVQPIAADFEERRELWRIFAYLAVLSVDPGGDFGRSFIPKLTAALDRYV
jgi:fructosamine-3-kinase